jgi:CDP-6-deoxy-D-xylo-4-hexulose-3-dehydrase
VNSEDLKQEKENLLQACQNYFKKANPKQAFIAGKTYIPVTAKVVDADDLSMLVDASLDMWLTSGRFGREFEANIASAMGRKTSGLFVNSGSSANLVAVSSLGSPILNKFGMKPLEKGDEVITAAAGFPTTVNPIIQNGWVPVFVDIDQMTLNATTEAVMQARTSKTKAVVLAHTLGIPFRSDRLADWCKKEGLFLVEDCCDALGATITTDAGETASVGTFGEYATLSFYPAHHITTGEGGAVLSKDGRLRKVAESMRDWGRDCWCEPGQDNTCGKRYGWALGKLPFGYDHKYTYSSLGYNLKSTDMQAAVGVSQLKKLPNFVAARRENWKALNTGVKSSPVLSEFLTPAVATEGTNPSWFGFPLHCADRIDREALVRYLEDSKVGTRLLFGGNLTKQPAYANVDYRIASELRATDQVMAKTFWIGTHPGLDGQKIAYMLECLESGIKKQTQ